jgi:Amt family ammonium transporter
MAALAQSGIRSGISLNLPENSNSTQQREILDALPVLIFLERAGWIVFANLEARETMGLAEDEWTRRPIEDVLWGLFPGAAEPRTELAGSRRGHRFHATLAGKGGRMTPVEGSYSMLYPELREGVIVAQVGNRDRAPKPRLMEDLLTSIPEAVAIVHDSHVIYTNAAFTEMFGFTAEEISGGNLRNFIVPETRQSENAILQRTLEQHGRASLETVRVTKNGELVDVSMRVAPLVVNGARAGHVLTYRDIGDRKDVEAKLQQDALHDVLTGLPNRALFQDRLELAMSRRARRRDQGCGVLFLDVDRFKEINDTLGHAVGDKLLIGIADRLRSTLRPQDTAARLSGDEFALLLENITSIADLDVVAKRVVDEFDRPFELLGHRVLASASIGAAMAGDDHLNPDLLLRDADLAMYRAKQQGGHRFEVFDRNMEVHVSDLRERERELRRVLDKHEFEFWHQPIFRLATGQVEGFESLLRWRRADGSYESFRDLLAIAEDTGLSISIGRDTLDAAWRQLQLWEKTIPGNSIMVTVNVTHRQFYHEDVVATLQQVLASGSGNPSRLLLEVSESVLNEHPDRAVAILQRVSDCGVRVAMDDFGAHLAPLNHLLRLPIEIVKMTPQMTIAATGNGRQLAMVQSLIHVCKAVGVQVLAQGIETKEQIKALHALGCELGQGNLLSPALDAPHAQQLASRLHRNVNFQP